MIFLFKSNNTDFSNISTENIMFSYQKNPVSSHNYYSCYNDPTVATIETVATVAIVATAAAVATVAGFAPVAAVATATIVALLHSSVITNISFLQVMLFCVPFLWVCSKNGYQPAPRAIRISCSLSHRCLAGKSLPLKDLVSAI